MTTTVPASARTYARIIKTGVVAAALAVGLVVQPANASEESVKLTNEGILLMEGGDLNAAIKKFRAALSDDRKDENARYYLAFAYVQDGNFSLALKFLESAEFEYWDANYLRGIASMNLQRQDDALGYFQASAKETENPQAFFYFGMLSYQAGNAQAAIENLEAAGELNDELEPYRQLYLGLAATSLENDEAATAYFATVQENWPESTAAELAAEMSGEGGEPDDDTKYVFWDLRFIEQWDTNPALVQSDDDLAAIYHADISDSTGAFRTALYTALRGQFGDDEGVSGRIGASGYGSVHIGNSAAEDYNAYQPMVFGGLSYNAESWGLDIPVQYSISAIGPLKDATRYSSSIAAGLAGYYNVSESITANGGMLLTYSAFDDAEERDGVNIAVPLGARISLIEDADLLAGYSLHINATSDSASQWKFFGNRIQVGANYRPIDRINISGGLYFFNRIYGNPFLIPGQGTVDRTDNEFGFNSAVRIGLGERTDLTLGYTGYKQSSIDLYTFGRHIITGSFGVTL